jgi:hypothetical protein
VTLVSVLIPSRGRPKLYERAVASLLDNASNPDDIEILARLDEDDYRQYENCTGTLLVDRSLGYLGQHEYNNQLAQIATGKWLMIGNDDEICQSAGWDEIIASYGDQLCELSLASNHGRDYACFPVVPRRWFEICGHLSLDCRIDSWLAEVAHGAGCFIEEDRIFILHDRADLTGNNDDEIYQQRYVDPAFWKSFDYAENRAARARDVALIRAAM